MGELLTFLGVSVLVIITPGPAAYLVFLGLQALLIAVRRDRLSGEPLIGLGVRVATEGRHVAP